MTGASESNGQGNGALDSQLSASLCTAGILGSYMQLRVPLDVYLLNNVFSP